MIKRKIILATAVLAFSLSACSDNQSQKQTTANSENKTIINSKKKGDNMKVTELTTADFKTKVRNYEQHPQEWVFEGKRPALVDFYATWCGPCKALSPIVEELAEKYDGKVDFYKVDVDKQEELAALFGIRSIPSLLFIPMEGQPEMSVGAMNMEQLQKAIEEKLIK